MKKGQKFEFLELVEFLKNEKSQWQIIATGGTFWYLNSLYLYKYNFHLDYFEYTDGGSPCFSMVAVENGREVAHVPFGGYDDLTYRIEVYNENPLEILIDWRENYEDGDSQLVILQKV